MRKGIIAVTLLACFGLSACGTVRTCVDRPILCAGVAAGIAGGVYYVRNGGFGGGATP